MLEAQRQCLNVVKKLMKSKDGWLFEVPVDWKLLQIPDYPDVVTNPMDLGTAKAKLEASKYSSVADFVADIELIWQNAIDYNGEESEMGEVALNMRADFQEKMQEVDKGASLKQTTPSKPAVSDAQAPKSNGGKASAAGSSSAPVKRSHHKAVEEGGVGNGSKVKAERPRSHHKPVGSGGVGNVGQVKLQKAEPGDKASGSALPAAGTGKLAGVKAVVLHLLKQKDAWLFGEPVDWKALGLTDYPLVVKRPMDLGTILKRCLGTGYFWPFAYEVQNVRNWPWHPTHAAFETLALLGVSPAHEPTAVQALLRNHSAWGPFMDEYVRDSLNIWSGSQEAQSLPGIARAANPEAGQAFYDFYFGWLANFSDAATGYWVPLCGQEDPPPAHCSSADRVNQLGGAFHLYHVHSCFGRAWPHPDKVVDATLASQDSATGRWKEPAGSRVSRDELSNCIDLDG
eukprot:gene111-7904_t